MKSENIATEKTEDLHASTRRKRKRRKKIFLNILIFVLSIGVWGGIVYYGYTYAKDYIDVSIEHVQQENAISLQQLTEEMQQLNQEITFLRESIEMTDSTLSNSTSVQERIDERLEALDNQLNQLERSLQILKEAPNVQN